MIQNHCKIPHVQISKDIKGLTCKQIDLEFDKLIFIAKDKNVGHEYYKHNQQKMANQS